MPIRKHLPRTNISRWYLPTDLALCNKLTCSQWQFNMVIFSRYNIRHVPRQHASTPTFAFGSAINFDQMTTLSKNHWRFSYLFSGNLEYLYNILDQFMVDKIFQDHICIMAPSEGKKTQNREAKRKTQQLKKQQITNQIKRNHNSTKQKTFFYLKIFAGVFSFFFFLYFFVICCVLRFPFVCWDLFLWFALQSHRTTAMQEKQ